MAEYLYGTGRNWKGNIRKAQFVVEDSLNAGIYFGDVDFDKKRISSQKDVRNYSLRRLANNSLEYTLIDFEPEEEEIFRFWSWISVMDELQFAFCENSPDPACEASNLNLPDEYLESLTLSQLRILRNMFFAIHGRIFKSPELDSYFRRFEWYKPREDFKEADLTEIQKRNVDRILEYEKKLSDQNLLQTSFRHSANQRNRTSWWKHQSISFKYGSAKANGSKARPTLRVSNLSTRKALPKRLLVPQK